MAARSKYCTGACENEQLALEERVRKTMSYLKTVRDTANSEAARAYARQALRYLKDHDD